MTIDCFAGNSLEYQNNRQFSTKDRDNDKWGNNCAQYHHGAFWYDFCQNSNLNGEYFRDGEINLRGVNWYHWKNNWYSMKHTEMKVKLN